MRQRTGFTLFFFAVFGFTVMVLMTACGEEPDNFTADFGYQYFPLAIGQERIYQVDSFVFDEVVGDVIDIDTSTTWFRDRVMEVFGGANGDSTYRVERSITKDTSNGWTFFTNYTLIKSAQNVQSNIENVRLIELVFPVQFGEVWDPTVYIPDGFTAAIAGEEIEIFKNWTARIRETGFRDSIGRFQFDDLARLDLADEENAIELREVKDWYARGVGLVQRQMRILNTQQAGADTLTWSEKAEEGFILQQTLVHYK